MDSELRETLLVNVRRVVALRDRTTTAEAVDQMRDDPAYLAEAVSDCQRVLAELPDAMSKAKAEAEAKAKADARAAAGLDEDETDEDDEPDGPPVPVRPLTDISDEMPLEEFPEPDATD